MSDAYVIETAGATAGIVVAERGFVRFYAAEPEFYALDGKRFRNTRAAHKAARALQQAKTATGKRFPDRRAA